MSRIIFAGLCFVLWPVARSLAADPAPRLVIDEPVFESREIRPGTVFSHEFTLLNEGDAPLLIEDVSTGCSCLVAAYDRSIAPGGRGRVHLAVDVYQKWAGRDFYRTVWLATNDPEAAQVSLVVRGRVAEEAADRQ